MDFGVIVAARTESRRLPGKALMPLGGLPMIRFLLERLRSTQKASQIVFATTQRPADDYLSDVVAATGIQVFRGADEDVVQRYVDAARAYGMEYVVRVTGDCPFTDAETLDYCLGECERFGPFDLASTKTAFPVGVDYEIYAAETLARLHEADVLSSLDREHLTKYLYDHAADFRMHVIQPPPQWRYRDRAFTVDTAEDYRFAAAMVGIMGSSRFRLPELIEATLRLP